MNLDYVSRQGIETRFIPASARLPSRIKAICESKSLILPVSAIPEENDKNLLTRHAYVALSLARYMGWFGHWQAGTVKSNQKGYVFLLEDSKNGSIFFV